jgi:hypothetical protein
MKKTTVALKQIEMKNYQPKNNLASLKISYQRDNEVESMYKDFTLADANELTKQIIQELKSRSKLELSESDDLLGSIFVIHFYDEDAIEEKLFKFMGKLCEKARFLKHTTNHNEYMKLFDDLKVQRASF